MKASYLSLITFTFLFITSCASPLPVSKLQSTGETEVHWNNGIEILTQNMDSLTIEAGFIRNEGSNYTFDISVTNFGNSPVLVDPAEIYYLPIRIDDDTLNLVRAVNPEHKILEEEKAISQLNADEKNKLAGGVLIGSLELAGEIASVGSNNESEEDDYSALDGISVDLAEIDRQRSYATDQRSYWDTQTLRKTTLFPRHFVQGQVIMRWSPEAEFILLRIPVGGLEFSFPFRQMIHPVY